MTESAVSIDLCPGFGEARIPEVANLSREPVRGCRPAPTCSAALREASARWPGRNRASDGICGDAAHASRPSDHNPDASGFAHAWDLTHSPATPLRRALNFVRRVVPFLRSPAPTLDTYWLADQLRLRTKAGTERRTKLIISNRRLASPRTRWEWERYGGPNPHSTHMHVSVTTAATHDTSPWFAFLDAKPPPPPPPPPAKPGPHGRLVAPTVKVRPHPGGAMEPTGHAMLAADGGWFNFGSAPHLGCPAGLTLSAPCVDFDFTPSGKGYWIVAADGGIFAYGDAPAFPSFVSRLGAGRTVTGCYAWPDGRALVLSTDDGGLLVTPDNAGLPLPDPFAVPGLP